MTSEPGLQPVSYRFTSAGTESVQWQVRRFRLQESLSEPYQLEIELWTADHDAHPAALLGDSCTLAIEREGQGRHVHGIIHQVDMLPAQFDRLRVRVTAAPALHLLRHQLNTRFWPNKTALQILEEVLKPSLARYGRQYEVRLDEAAFLPREYCVQYRETDLEFAARIMHEEGIVYAFEHEEGEVECMVLYDNIMRAEELGVQQLPYVPSGNGVAGNQSIDSLDWSRRLGVTSVVQRDWAWRGDPTQAPAVDAPTSFQHERRAADERQRDRERYDHDDRRFNQDDGSTRLKHKHAAEGYAAESGLGISDAVEMIPGRYFDVQLHPVPERDGRYLLLSIFHTGDAPEVSAGEKSSDDGPRYQNEFRCIPANVPYFGPPIPARQRVHGPHTAVVVGPDNHDDIHTDEHGRIRVIFHWDRLSPHDETASCWVRVAQTWAGPRWGHQFIPRVGMEVLVEFLDGDPDRPMVVGCVYNGLNRPPYTLPDNKTQSGIKTDSSPGGGGSNELRFEDAKGREELWIHAEKDFNERVENNHSTSVGANQSTSVGGNQSNTVSGDQTEAVTGAQTVTVQKNRTVSVTGSQSVAIQGGEAADGVCGSKLNITGDYIVDASLKVEMQAPTHIKLTCGGSSILIEPGKISLTAGGKATLVLDANALLMASGGANLQLDGAFFGQAHGGAALLLDGNVTARANEGAELLLNADATLTSSGCSQVKLDGSATVTGVATATITAPNTTLDGGGNTVVAGGGVVAVTGGMIKLNS